MAKRLANNDLNHENWDEEYDPEDAGSFKRASAEVLKTRVYKTARRRNPIASTPSTSASDESPDKRNVFGGFTGFSKAPVSTTTAFGFLYNSSKAPKPDSRPKVNGISHLDTTMDSNPPKLIDDSQHDDAYLSKLKGLNSSVASWIKRHVDENPFVNLKPVFRDYEKYFDELELEKKPGEMGSKLIVDSIASTSKSFCFGIKPTVGEKPPDTVGTIVQAAPSSNLSNMFNFGQQTKTTSSITTSSSTAPKFSFSTSSVAPQTTSATSTTSLVTSMFKPPSSGSGFAFAGAAQPVSSTPFSFANVSVSSTSITGTADGGTVGEADEEEPPKVEFTPVDEEGYVYKVRCKVFVKKDKEKTFGDRGVGNMFLKPIPDSAKMQLIVRADTNLGNLLCNFVLSSAIPTKRIGKKDVMLVCIPTPDVAPPPVPILLRVKSTEEADELLATLEKHKK